MCQRNVISEKLSFDFEGCSNLECEILRLTGKVSLESGNCQGLEEVLSQGFTVFVVLLQVI